jgi:predicted metal-binding protein
MNIIRIGIIICDRYRTCAGGKCLRSMKERTGAFKVYSNAELELVGYTGCGGCPGGNIEYAPQEMLKNKVDFIHLATGMIVGYPPCSNLKYFGEFIERAFNVKVVFGTHPIPQNYYMLHRLNNKWDKIPQPSYMKPLLSDEDTRLAYM